MAREDCQKCPLGFFCPKGTDIPKICPKGYYCPESSGAPFPCPIGTYSSREKLHYREDCTPCSPGWYIS